MRRAFAPLGLCVLALACPALGCQAPASASPAGEQQPSELRSATLALKPGAAGSSFGESHELPERAVDFELDPYAPPVGYGEGARESLERACERALGPGCRDERAQLARVVRFRYRHPREPESSVDGVLSRHRDELGAYARFTEAVLGEGDSDPEQAAVSATPLDAGRLVLRGDSAFAWRGRELLWLRHVDEGAPAARREQAARSALPGLARAILAHLGAPDTLPALVQHLPEAGRLPLGVRLLLDEAFGVPGLGPSALGHYRAGGQRWRMAVVLRPDEESAREVLHAVERQAGARPVEQAPFSALLATERTYTDEPARSWVITRRGEVVYGVAEEGLPGPGVEGARAGVELTVQDKLSKLQGVSR